MILLNTIYIILTGRPACVAGTTTEPAGVSGIKYKAPGRCPVCDEPLLVKSLGCPKCATKVEGEFRPCRFCQLPEEQREFIEVFLRCRGNIKNVEKELGISYPTVRNRLDAALAALGYGAGDPAEEEGERRRRILAALERGEMTAQEAARRLRDGEE